MSQVSIYNVIQALAGAETGRRCRRCGEAIARSDSFGMSEAVCSACRFDSDR